MNGSIYLTLGDLALVTGHSRSMIKRRAHELGLPFITVGEQQRTIAFDCDTAKKLVKDLGQTHQLNLKRVKAALGI